MKLPRLLSVTITVGISQRCRRGICCVRHHNAPHQLVVIVNDILYMLYYLDQQGRTDSFSIDCNFLLIPRLLTFVSSMDAMSSLAAISAHVGMVLNPRKRVKIRSFHHSHHLSDYRLTHPAKDLTRSVSILCGLHISLSLSLLLCLCLPHPSPAHLPCSG